MTDFQLRLIDILTTPDEEYERAIELVDEESFNINYLFGKELD